jgi:hypothetical protein
VPRILTCQQHQYARGAHEPGSRRPVRASSSRSASPTYGPGLRSASGTGGWFFSPQQQPPPQFHSRQPVPEFSWSPGAPVIFRANLSGSLGRDLRNSRVSGAFPMTYAVRVRFCNPSVRDRPVDHAVRRRGPTQESESRCARIASPESPQNFLDFMPLVALIN